MGLYEQTTKQRRRRRKRTPAGPIIAILLLITLVAIIGTVLLRSCERKEAEVVTTQATTLPKTEEPSIQIITTTEAATEVSTEATTEATTEPTTVPTEETTEATTVPTTAPPTEPPVPATEPPSSDEKAVGQQIADLAIAQVGKPYVYGGVGPDEFDASGFIIYCIGEITGTSLPHSTSYQSQRGDLVDKGDLLPGDVVFFWTSEPGSAEFVGVYVGGGQFVAARNPEKPVSQLDMGLDYFSERYLFARRYW